MTDAPQFPAGPFELIEEYDDVARERMTDAILHAPTRLRRAAGGLDDKQLDTKYRNWTIRQIVHHLADSHLNSMMRFKWTLTEDKPTIKAYFEDRWVSTLDAREGDVEPALFMLDGLHLKWVQVLRSMSESDYARELYHPERERFIRLWEALNDYAYHGDHHTAQILWLREQNGW